METSVVPVVKWPTETDRCPARILCWCDHVAVCEADKNLSQAIADGVADFRRWANDFVGDMFEKAVVGRKMIIPICVNKFGERDFRIGRR